MTEKSMIVGPPLTCSVCSEREAFGVVASSLAPTSYPICIECLRAGKEPQWIIDAMKEIAGS